MIRRATTALAVAICVAAWAASGANAAVAPERGSEPIVLEGADLPGLTGTAPGRIVAFAWDGGWEQVPVQIDERAVVDGDFAMRESELQPVLRALRGAGIDIVAIHQHMAGEEPRIVFLHYWGVGGTRDLALGLRKALDQTDSGRVS